MRHFAIPAVAFIVGLAMPFTVQAVSMDCGAYLKQLQPYVGALKVFQPKRGLVPVVPEVLEFVNQEGGTVDFLGKGKYGRVFRWKDSQGSSKIIKYFLDGERSISGKSRLVPWQEQIKIEDQSFKVLRQLIRPEDGIRVVDEVLLGSGRMRFYQDIAGETLGDFIRNSNVPLELRQEVVQVFRQLQNSLVQRMQNLYGVRHVEVKKVNSPASGLVPLETHWNMIIGNNAQLGAVVLDVHLQNVIVEAATGQLWIIDPL